MAISYAILCPGQGAQHVGMGKDFYAKCGASRRIFDQADEILGFSLSKICFEGPELELQATDVAQAGIFVTSAAIYEALLELGRLPQAPDVAAGLSLGEYTALHIAGVLKFADAVRLVRARGQLMQAAAMAHKGSMLALVGADEAAADAICSQAKQVGVIVPANFNAPGQIVLSGAAAACDAAAKVAETMGFRAVPLSVAGAFHSPLMDSAARAMSAKLELVEFSPARMPVLSNVTAQPHGEAAAIRQLLVQQIIAPVRWSQSMSYLLGQGAKGFLELGPGRVLAGLMRKIDRKAVVTNISTLDG